MLRWPCRIKMKKFSITLILTLYITQNYNCQLFGGQILRLQPSQYYPPGQIWCPFATTVVEVTNPYTQRTWMDRNLGASQVATSATDALAYGDLYQWGRRSDGHQCRNSPLIYSLSSTDVPPHGSFIVSPSPPNDWRSPQNTNLWQGVNGINNPCPKNFRLPTQAELESERLSWINYPAPGYFNSPLKFTRGGDRIDASGTLNMVGTSGLYWSSTTFQTFSYYLVFNSSTSSLTMDDRAFGCSVRCIKN